MYRLIDYKNQNLPIACISKAFCIAFASFCGAELPDCGASHLEFMDEIGCETFHLKLRSMINKRCSPFIPKHGLRCLYANLPGSGINLFSRSSARIHQGWDQKKGSRCQAWTSQRACKIAKFGGEVAQMILLSPSALNFRPEAASESFTYGVFGSLSYKISFLCRHSVPRDNLGIASMSLLEVRGETEGLV